MTNKQRNAADRRINAAYNQHCSGVQIRMMDIGRIFDIGRKAIENGADDAALVAAIIAFVETIRTN